MGSRLRDCAYCRASRAREAAIIGPFVKAVLIGLTGIFLLDSMGAIVKHLGDTYPAPQLAAFRNLIGLVPTLAILFASREWHAAGRPLRIAQWQLGLGRGLFVTFAQFCFYTSIIHLEFATASTLAFAGPLFVTAFSVPVLGERVGRWRWAAVAIGFGGVALIMRPGGDVFSPYALLPVCAAAGYAMSAVTVRLFDTSVPSPVVNLYGHLGAFSGAAILTGLTTGYVPIAATGDWLWIAAMGLLGGTGVLLLVVAYRLTRPSNLAPFDYFGIVFAFGLGWVFFDEAPFDQLFPGVLLIVGGGLLIVWREWRRD